MAKDLRGTWKDTGVGLGHAFRDLGKTLVKTGATAAKKVDKWANGEEQPEQAEQPQENEQVDPTPEESAE